MTRILTRVIAKDLTSPPASPPLLANYIIATSGNGAWLNHVNEIARTENGGTDWTFISPDQDAVTWVENEMRFYSWQGNVWVPEPSEVNITSGNIPLQVIHDVSLPKEAILNFVGAGKVMIDASMELLLYRPENIKATDSQQVKTGDGKLSFSMPGRIPVPWFGVESGTTTEQNDRLREACQALQDAGGGHLYFPPGTYRFYGIGEADDATLCNFEGLTGIAITGYGVILALDPTRNWTNPQKSANFFLFRNCHNIYINGFEGTGPDITPDGFYPYSVAFSRFENGCSNIRIPYVRLQGWQAAVIAARPENAPNPEQVISRGFTLGQIDVKDCTYGVNFLRSGHDTTIELLRTENVYRSFFIYGTENVKANIISLNPKGRDIKMFAVCNAQANIPLRNIKVKYTNIDSNDTGNKIGINLSFDGSSTGGIIEGVDLDVFVRYGTSNQMGAVLWVAKYNNSIQVDDAGPRGHQLRNLHVRAFIDGDPSIDGEEYPRGGPGDQAGAVLRTEEGCDWTGETWSNVLFEEITVVNNPKDTSIIIDPSANTDELTFRNVVLPGALDLWGSSQLDPIAPNGGKLIIDAVHCSNLNQPIVDGSTRVQPVKVVEFLNDQSDDVSAHIPIGWQGLTISNSGANATIGYNLPPAKVGLEYSFIQVTNISFIRIYPNREDPPFHKECIRGGEPWFNNKDGRYLSLDSQGCFVTLRCYITGSWEIIDRAGTIRFESFFSWLLRVVFG